MDTSKVYISLYTNNELLATSHICLTMRHAGGVDIYSFIQSKVLGFLVKHNRYNCYHNWSYHPSNDPNVILTYYCQKDSVKAVVSREPLLIKPSPPKSQTDNKNCHCAIL